MKVGLSGQAGGVAFLVIGLVIGAGLVFVTTYLNGGYHTESTTTTSTIVSSYTTSEFSTYTLATTTTVTITNPTTIIGSAQVVASVVACNYNNMVSGAEACEVVLTNSGNANTATTGSCSLSYGGGTHEGEVTGGGTVAAGSYLTVTCSYKVGSGASTGTQITGAIFLTDGDSALFSGTASP
jgi:hypothetical protein